MELFNKLKALDFRTIIDKDKCVSVVNVFIIFLVVVINVISYKYLPKTMKMHGSDTSFPNLTPKLIYLVIMPLIITGLTVYSFLSSKNERIKIIFANIIIFVANVLVIIKNIK